MEAIPVDADRVTPEIDLQSLGREIAARMAPDALLDAADVGALLKYDPRYITDELQHSPQFPKPVRFELRGGRKTHPRWRRSDITAMVDNMAMGAGKPGRPRRRIET
jgi:hypothetical protein